MHFSQYFYLLCVCCMSTVSEQFTVALKITPYSGVCHVKSYITLVIVIPVVATLVIVTLIQWLMNVTTLFLTKCAV